MRNILILLLLHLYYYLKTYFARATCGRRGDDFITINFRFRCAKPTWSMKFLWPQCANWPGDRLTIWANRHAPCLSTSRKLRRFVCFPDLFDRGYPCRWGTLHRSGSICGLAENNWHYFFPYVTASIVALQAKDARISVSFSSVAQVIGTGGT